MAEKRVIEYEAASELANDDWLLIDGVTEGTRKARPSTVTAELGEQVTNIATIVGGLTQVTMGHGQSFAPSYDESTSYDVGDLVMKYACLYKCTAPTTGTWDSSKWQLATVSEQLEESGKIDDVQVNGVSVVTDKVARIDLTGMQDDIDSKQADTKIGGTSILDNNHVANLDFLASYGEASGEIASFNDGAAMPLKSLKVGIEPVQSGSGDPSPTNVRPFTGWSAVNVVKCGKNLWGGEKLADDIVAKVPNATKDTTNKTVAYSAGYVSGKVLFDNFKPNTIYTIFMMTSSSANNVMVRYTDGTNTYINKDTITVTQANKSIECIIGIWSTGTTVLKYDECGIFEGVLTAEDFVPYNGTTYTTQLKDGQGNPLTCYGGQLDVVSGELVVDRTMVDLGSLNWALENGIFRLNESIGAKLTANTSAVANMLCSIYKTVSQNAMGSTTTDQCIAGLNWSNGVRVKDSNYTDVASFNQAMDGVQLVYELATPITIQLTPTAVKSLLGTNNLWADSGDILECKYVRDNSAVINDLIARVTALENA